MKAFVTGGTGFIGGHVVRKLRERGYAVTALARSGTAPALAALGADVVRGDIGDRESLRAMAGHDVVFHIAGWYKIGARDPTEGQRINVDGTRNVLGTAHDLGIPRIVYTSTLATYGDTRGAEPTEATPMAGRLVTEYDRTKWAAHHEVAVPLIEAGAPITIVMPGGVYGPGDTSLVGDLMRLYYRGLLAVVPGPETGFTFAHVEDIAEGHILAFERGVAGESYHLSGPALTLGQTVRLWAQILGRRPPRLSLPAALLRPSAPLMALVGRVVPLPPVLSAEATASMGVTYLGRSDKARRALGWRTRPLRQGFAETFAWIAAHP
jgi:nucleoside-diphosphate-sugar epimerase